MFIKRVLKIDDSLDVFGIHGVAGVAGAIGLALLLRPGHENSLATQLGYQAEGVGISIAYAAACTLALVVLVDKTLGMRMSRDAELAGMDHSLHGEAGYGLLNLN